MVAPSVHLNSHWEFHEYSVTSAVWHGFTGPRPVSQIFRYLLQLVNHIRREIAKSELVSVCVLEDIRGVEVKFDAFLA